MEKEIKIYHVETQEDYADLMVKLENEGYTWANGDLPTIRDYWWFSKECSYVAVDEYAKKLRYGHLNDIGKNHPDQTVIKYKTDKTDKAKELQKYSEQIAKKKEELSNEHTQDNHKLFNEIITDLEQTYIAKNKDYGNSFEESLNEFGEIAGLVRIGDKFNRAKNLSENKANVTDESKIDTYLDMANYCIMQAMWLMKSKL